MKIAALAVLMLAGCHPVPYRAAPVRVDVPWPVRQQPVIRRVQGTVVETPEGMDSGGGDYVSPIQAIKGAAEEKDRAKNYVLAPHSRPEAIDELTRLSLELDAARKRMEETREKTGKYDRQDVIALSRVRRAMQEFIDQVNGH